MPEWATHVIVGVCSAGFVMAVFKGYTMLTVARARVSLAKQQATHAERLDEIGVLHRSIDELRVERDGDRKDYRERERQLLLRVTKQEKDLTHLASEHTACKFETAMLRREINRMRGQQNLPPLEEGDSVPLG